MSSTDGAAGRGAVRRLAVQRWSAGASRGPRPSAAARRRKLRAAGLRAGQAQAVMRRGDLERGMRRALFDKFPCVIASVGRRAREECVISVCEAVTSGTPVWRGAAIVHVLLNVGLTRTSALCGYSSCLFLRRHWKKENVSAVSRPSMPNTRPGRKTQAPRRPRGHSHLPSPDEDGDTH